MPGISFICDFNEDLVKKKSMILKALDSMIHFDHYKKNILLEEKSYFLGTTTYDEYPITSFENNEYLIYLEGKIYGKDYSGADIALNNLARLVFQSQYISKEKITEWLLNTDGDFIVFILNKKSNEITIINDALGHLPLYYYKTDGKLLISRELRFITNLISDITFDRMSIAQYLLFRYTLGKRTLLENVFRLEPSTLIKINFINSKIEIYNVHRFNFEKKEYSKRTIEENANQLVTIFNKACKNRIQSGGGYKNILSLSGGLDSRAVGACLQKNNIAFYGTTLLKFDKTNENEVEIAKHIAKVLNADWTSFKLDPTKGKDFLKLLKIKNGMNFLSVSLFIPYLDKIKETYGSRVNFFTGDGGDRSIADHMPYKNLKNLNDLVNYITTRQVFSLDDVAALTKIQKEEIINELKNHVLSYPEKDWNQKYVHFMIYEDANNWVKEGLDRNRFYFWSLAPLWSIHMFNYAMGCHDKQKVYYKLYRKFLYKLSPQATAVKYANYNVSIMSKKLAIKLFIISKMPRKIKSIIKKQLKSSADKHNSYEYNSNIMNCLREQLQNCKSISDYLPISKIESIIGKCSKNQFETLFTITSSIEEYECDVSTIERYYESDFV